MWEKKSINGKKLSDLIFFFSPSIAEYYVAVVFEKRFNDVGTIHDIVLAF